MAPLRVAIIGSGIFMRETYLPNIQVNASRVQLTAVLSRTAESIAEALAAWPQEPQSPAVRRYVGPEGEEAFFAEAQQVCDAVIVVVPIPLLGQYVQILLGLGVHILSEKPVAVTSAEAQRLVTLYRQQPSVSSASWHVAENYRLEPAVEFARGLVEGHVCKPKTFTLIALRQQSASSKYAVTSWRAKPSYNGSFVLDGGIHFVALLRTVLGGSVDEVRAHYHEDSVVEVGTCGSCVVSSPGCRAVGTFHIQYGAFVTPVCRLDVYFDDGKRIFVSISHAQTHAHRHTHSHAYTHTHTHTHTHSHTLTHTQTAAILSIIQHKGVGYEVAFTGLEPRHFPFAGLEREFVVWLDALESGRQEESLSPEEGLVDLRIIEDMCQTERGR